MPLLCPAGATSAPANLLPVGLDGGYVAGAPRIRNGTGLMHAWPIGEGMLVYMGAQITPASAVFAAEGLADDRGVWTKLMQSVFYTGGLVPEEEDPQLPP
eukprot:174463-Chlamydomonas_euryale.AAC.1